MTARRGTAIQRRVCALLPYLGVTQDSLAAFLSSAWGRDVDRSVVSRWHTGDRSMPVDALVALVRHAEVDDTDAGERVLQVLAREVGLHVVRLPPARGDASELTSRVLQLGGIVGQVQAQVGAALADGEVDAEERRELGEVLETLLRDVTRLQAAVRA